MLGILEIAAGRAHSVVVGGMENPSQTNTRGYWILDLLAESAKSAAQVHHVTQKIISG